MSAETALTAASKIGLRINLDGEDLVLKADAPPPSDILDLIAQFKPQIVAALRHRGHASEWVEADWRGFFNERAGVLEFDAGLAREDAKARAFADCIAEWLNRHPVASDPGHCLTCGRCERDGAAVVPFRTGVSGEAWLHPGCWPAWREAREAAAIDALRQLGIAPLEEGASR